MERVGQSASAIPRRRNWAGFKSGFGLRLLSGLNGVQSRAHLRRHRLRDCSKWTLRPCLCSFRHFKISVSSELMISSPKDAVDVDNDADGVGGLHSLSLILSLRVCSCRCLRPPGFARLPRAQTRPDVLPAARRPEPPFEDVRVAEPLEPKHTDHRCIIVDIPL